VGIVSQGVAALLGVTLGLLAGYYGRWVDAVLMRLADVTLAFPTLLLLIAIAAAIDPPLVLVFVVIGAVGWAAMARLVRSQVLVLRSADYVTAARALGAPGPRILLHHLLPNVRSQVIVATTLGAAGAMMAEAALSFVGLGVKPPTPSWGSMVADGRDLLRVAPASGAGDCIGFDGTDSIFSSDCETGELKATGEPASCFPLPFALCPLPFALCPLLFAPTE
jgi:ABC-type dipeptide/oligopeptide/nickel transport system permease subunit